MILPSTIKKLKDSYAKKKAFVLYAQPNSDIISSLFQKDNTVSEASEDCENAFVFAPFLENEKHYCLFKDHAEEFQEVVVLNPQQVTTMAYPEVSSEKKSYESLVAKAIQYIKDRQAKKIVVSRKQTFSLQNFDFDDLLCRIFLIYPNTFRYLWYHPETGLWCGATPEILLNTQAGCFNTMALAGTKPNHLTERIVWGDKEKDEHQIVVDEIVKKLQSALSVIKVSKTSNYSAGPVIHLKTDIMGHIKKGKSSLYALAKKLHPTSAVCGLPGSGALKFITKYEGYDREYYTGYLGLLLSKNESSSLYVNLRCMKLDPDGKKAHIYVGGGITQDSVPSEEWQETQNKLLTMLSVLQPFLAEN